MLKDNTTQHTFSNTDKNTIAAAVLTSEVESIPVCIFSTHSHVARAGDGDREKRGGGAAYLFWACMLKNCFLMGSQRASCLCFGCLDNSLETSATSLAAKRVVRAQLRASWLLLRSGRNLSPCPLLVPTWCLTKEHTHTQDFVRHAGRGSVDVCMCAGLVTG